MNRRRWQMAAAVCRAYTGLCFLAHCVYANKPPTTGRGPRGQSRQGPGEESRPWVNEAPPPRRFTIRTRPALRPYDLDAELARVTWWNATASEHERSTQLRALPPPSDGSRQPFMGTASD